MNEDDKLWPVPDRIGRQVCMYKKPPTVFERLDIVLVLHEAH